MSNDVSGFRPGWVHFTIFGLGMFLVGMNRPDTLPLGFSHIALQTGIVGCIAALGLGHLAAQKHASREKIRAIAHVEERMEEIFGEIKPAHDEMSDSMTMSCEEFEAQMAL